MPSSDLFAPGEPAPSDTTTDAPSEPAPPPVVANTDEGTGTAVDGVDLDPGMTDDAIQQALAAAMRGEELDDDLNPIAPSDPSSPQGTQAPGGDADQGSADPASAADPAPSYSPGTVPGAAPDDPSDPMASPGSDFIELPGLGSITRAEAEQIAALAQWGQSLTPDQAQAINDLLSGEFVLAPRIPGAPASTPDPSAASGPGVPSPAGGVGAPAGVGSTYYQPPVPEPEFDPSQYADPDLARLVYQQQQTLANLAAQQQAAMQQQALAAQQQVRQEQARLQAEADAATLTFAEERGLDMTTAQQLVETAVQMQVIPSLMAKHGNDPRKAMAEALDVAYWTNPTTRAAAIQAQLAEYAQQQQDTDEKKRRAAALSGSGGAVPRVAPPAQPLTKQQREQAMVAELAAAMNGQG